MESHQFEYCRKPKKDRAKEGIPSRANSRMANSTNIYPPPGYVDDFLSIFDRTPRSQIHAIKTAKHQKAVSSENLLKKAPSMTAAPAESNGDPWNSGFARRIPYSGTLALSAVLLCAVADAVILWKSDGREVEGWAVSPSVLLAILSAVANINLQFARSQGVVIAWWRKALRGGKLDDLNRY